MSENGTVYLAGAGPGDPGLLTLRAAELLSRAQVVIYDALVNPAILRHAPDDAEIIYAGKRANQHAIPQNQLNELLVTHAQAGKTVIRLKGGDPFLFGRGGEEAERLAQAGIPFEIVPGITSISAVPAYAGIPATHRDHCSSITILTGHEKPGKSETAINWQHVADEPGTRLILMGIDRLPEITGKLIECGLAKNTPAALIRWGTTGRQRTLIGTLAEIAIKAEAANFTAPAIILFGTVIALREHLNWFEQRPLFGQRIVVTRTRRQASRLSARLTELGADVLEIPTIKIIPPDDKQPLIDAMLGIANYDWLVFTSPNGVDQYFRWFFETYDDIRAIGGCQIAAVGPATAAKLKQLHLKVDLTPSEYTTAGVANALQQHQSIENLQLCLPRAQVANPELPKALVGMGAIVDDIPVYQTIPEEEDRTQSAARLMEEGADWITFTSSSTVEHFHTRFDLPKLIKDHNLKTASIGPETTKTLEKLKTPPTIEADTHNIEGLINALKSASVLST